MSDDMYIPIDCGLHSDYELLAMHRREVDVCWDSAVGMEEKTGRVMGVFTRNKAEYLQLLLAGGDIVDIRLDRIRKIKAK
jgi:transcriptional antiterminator Rof (Rho-off)